MLNPAGLQLQAPQLAASAASASRPNPMEGMKAPPPRFRLRDLPRNIFDHMNKAQANWQRDQDMERQMRRALLDRVLRVAEPEPQVQAYIPEPFEEMLLQKPEGPRRRGLPAADIARIGVLNSGGSPQF